jgi:hypothetical protein
MPLYSFKGHYPVEQIDNNKGWYEVPDKPVAPENKQVSWINGEWIVREPKPEDRQGWQWNWDNEKLNWVEFPYRQTIEDGWVWVETVDSETGMVSGGDWEIIFCPDDGKEYYWDKHSSSWVKAATLEDFMQQEPPTE